MADIASLTEHVEAHPGDYEQRWRLAKKLYEAHEYAVALEHLEILRDEWVAKINLVRYLAAVYYRLDRHADSIAALATAVRAWPRRSVSGCSTPPVVRSAPEEERFWISTVST